ncbi:hypothetical protein BS17DRAFT_805711 [Gyrodon lividus]|nr:hypothetical protein BS17DRAFT_805711 [Gyrodon lividus]
MECPQSIWRITLCIKVVPNSEIGNVTVRVETIKVDWTGAKSTRFHPGDVARNNAISLPSRSLAKLVSDLPRRHTSILVWLKTRHVSLNAHLHKITKAASPECPHCPGTREDVPHFILEFPHHARERQTLARHLRRQAYHHLLSNSKAIPQSMNYVNGIGRLKTTFGEVSMA